MEFARIAPLRLLASEKGRPVYYRCEYESPLGTIALGSNGTALTGLWFVGQKYFAQGLPDDAKRVRTDELPVFSQTKRWLDTYFSGEEPDFTPPLEVEGTPFRREVCQALLEIPYGQTATYGDIAQKLSEKRDGTRTSARAVGGAVGHNPISLIIPCHRVVGASGSLTGYAGGIDRKLKLLTMEGANLNGCFIPKHSTAM